MRLSIITAACLFLGHSAIAVPVLDERLPMLSDASDFSDSVELDKRLSTREFVAILGAGTMGLLNVPAIARYVSDLIKQRSNMNSCGVITGEVDKVHYQYHAKSTGSKCDTTAEVKTIRKGLERALNYMKNAGVNHACFHMTHGGTWKGVLQIAGEGRIIIDGKCDIVDATVPI